MGQTRWVKHELECRWRFTWEDIVRIKKKIHEHSRCYSTRETYKRKKNLGIINDIIKKININEVFKIIIFQSYRS